MCESLYSTNACKSPQYQLAYNACRAWWPTPSDVWHVCPCAFVYWQWQCSRGVSNHKFSCGDEMPDRWVTWNAAIIVATGMQSHETSVMTTQRLLLLRWCSLTPTETIEVTTNRGNEASCRLASSWHLDRERGQLVRGVHNFSITII